MQDFDLLAIAATLCEFLGGWVWVLAIGAVIWLALMALALTRGGAGGCRAALTTGVIAWVVAVLGLPTLTGSELRFVTGVDWAILLTAGLGVGIAAALVVWPLVRLASAHR